MAWSKLLKALFIIDQVLVLALLFLGFFLHHTFFLVFDVDSFLHTHPFTPDTSLCYWTHVTLNEFPYCALGATRYCYPIIHCYIFGCYVLILFTYYLHAYTPCRRLLSSLTA